MKLVFKVPSNVLFRPIINRLQGLDQLFYIYSVKMAYLPPLLLHPPPQPPPLHRYLALLQPPHLLSLNILTALWAFLQYVCSCLTCKPLRCLIVWFASQSAKHVDTLIAHLGVSLHLSLYTLQSYPSFSHCLSKRMTEPFRNGARDWS